MSDILNWVFFGLGVTVTIASIAALIVMRAEYRKPAQSGDPGLIRRYVDHPPKGSRPGMLGVLNDGRIEFRDLLITIIDLATRGALVIRPVGTPESITDWEVRHAVGTAADMSDFEVTLSEYFSDEGPCSVADLTEDDEIRRRAIKQLQHASDETGWYQRGAQAINAWGLVGAAVMLIGLSFFAIVIVMGIFATVPKAGALGAILLVASGVLLTSLGRLHRARTEAGTQARDHLDKYCEWLADLAPHQITAEASNALFNENLAAAIALRRGATFGETFEVAAQRMSAWSQTLPIDLEWLDTSALGTAVGSPRTAVEFADQFVTFALVAAERVGINIEEND